MPAQISRALLQNLAMFQAMTTAELDAALAHAQATRLKEGDAAFRQGEPVERFFILLGGHLKVMQITADGEQVVVRYVNPGDVFGIARAMGRQHYPATALAVEESLVISWPASDWDNFITHNAQFASSALQTVGQRLQDAHSRIRELSTEEVEQRVARAILRLAEKSGEPVDGGIRINFPITRQDIAEMTGTTLHTVSRLLSDWKDKGWVDTGRKRISVLSPEKLSQLANGARPG